MWGTSFEDLAKKAAEIQEQATASMTSPVAPSFSVGGMFNMDALQQKDETDPDKKKDDLKNLAQQAMSEAKSGAVSSSSATFYNPMQRLQLQQPQQQQQQQQMQQHLKRVQQPQQQPQQQPPASKMQQPQSFMSNMSMNMNSIKVSPMSMPSMSLITPNNFNNSNNNAQSTTITKSFGTAKATPGGSSTTTTKTPAMKTPAKNLFPASAAKSSLAIPKGKLGLPVISMNNKNLGNNNNNNSNVNVNVNTMNKSAIPGGSNKLKIKPPASSLITKTPASANVNNNNNNALREPKKQGGGLVIGTNKNQSSNPATATTSKLAPAAKQTQATTGPTTTTTTTTTSKLVAPKQIAKQQSSSSKVVPPKDLSKAEPQPKPAKQQLPQPSTPATAALPKDSKNPQQQRQQQQQQSATPQATAAAPIPTLPTTDTAVPKKVPDTSVTAEKDAKQEAKSSSKEPIVSGGGTTEPTTTTNATTESSSQDESAEETSPSTSLPLPAPDKNESVLRKQQLQQQQEQFEKKLEKQSQQMEGRMQQLQQQFSEQLQRLEEHHKNETETTNAQHEASLAHWQQQVRDREMFLESQSQAAEANEMKSQAMVQKLSSDLKQAREYIADKKVEDLKLQEAHLQQLRDMEKQCFKKEDDSNSLEQEMKNIEKKLEESKKETKKALDDFDKLKGRAKSVAGELKEKRAECRTLSSEIDLLERSKNSLQERVTELEATGMDMNQSSEETQSKLDSLQSSLDEMKKELEVARVAFENDKKKVEDSLSNYKKKAQQSLALANARSASAVQTREEAEMEARAARSTADTAMERAMKSEFNGKQALAEAKVYVEQMKGEVDKYESVKAKLEEASKELKQAHTEAETNKDSSEKLRCELTSLSGRLEAEQATVQDLKESLTDAQNRSNELYDEVERLRNGSRLLQGEIKRLSEANKTAIDSSFASEEEQADIVRGANAEAEATIAMLQQELQDSNRAIKDLKETLKATMEEKDSFRDDGGYPNGGKGAMNGNHQQSETNGMPLYYAMEKQAELAQARDEIARMANLLGDAESSKQDAFDEMHIMKRLMEDAQSKLQRQEQLQTKSAGEEKSLNLEYLKNIVLSYLNAESVQEKKALLPVIGTVLCLTQAEQSRAIEKLDKGSGSVMDSVATSVLGLKWS